MKQIIEQLYKTKTVVDRNGKTYELKAAIDRREGELLFDIIHQDFGILKTLEVGCAYGLSSLYICSALQGRSGAFHTIIDPFQNTTWHGIGIKHLEEAEIDFFHHIEAKSEFALPQLLAENERKFDFIFIDGLHTFDHTLLDCFYANRLLRVGGYLAIDDVSFSSVRRVVDFFKSYPCYEEYRSVSSTGSKPFKKLIARALISPIPQKIWAKILRWNLYHKIFEDKIIRTIVLKKIAEDNRRWDWHNDAF
ncbi:MAG: class I SAM-dependent methyltransferase [Cyanobacteria bacterium SBLK]|nr:class I SAM-dependent methyltransferase [Cyanobacteria bacterium SBLK]